MSGGVLQLVAYGAQDIYITGEPEITYFKTLYRRHTNFSMETKEVPLDTKGDFGRKASVIIPRKGDLAQRVFLKVVINGIKPSEGSKFGWVRLLGYAMMRSMTIEIGGAQVEELDINSLINLLSLTRVPEKDVGTAKILGNVTELIEYNNEEKPEYTMYIELPFLQHNYLPLIALQYHDVKLRFDFLEKERLVIANDKFKNKDMKQIGVKDMSLLVNYIYLDAEERRKIAQMPMEIMVRQIQSNNGEFIDKIGKYNMDFNHPVMEILWVIINRNYVTGKKFLFYTPRNWGEHLLEASEKILRESILLSDNTPNRGTDFFPPWIEGFTGNGKIKVINKSDKYFTINRDALIDKKNRKYNLINKISCNILIDENGGIIISDLSSSINIRDLSVPVDAFFDTRYRRDDPCVYIYGNYGVLIDGSINPVHSASIEFNGVERLSRKPGSYYNYVQPDQHHTNTPVDGINTYSFALYPEKPQSTGTANFSRFDSAKLNVDIKDPTKKAFLPAIFPGGIILIYALSRNILRVMSGMAGIVFSN